MSPFEWLPLIVDISPAGMFCLFGGIEADPESDDPRFNLALPMGLSKR